MKSPGSHRDQAVFALRAGLLIACAIACTAVAVSQEDESDASPAATQPGVIDESIRIFDFNERPLGNFEDTPMYWAPMRGEGLPAYSSGRFDDRVGHDAAPSFRIDLQGGNVTYEYQRDDIIVAADSDYLVTAYVRAVGLVHAGALIMTQLVDEHGEPHAGARRTSAVVRSIAAANEEEPWQRVEISVLNHRRTDARLRLRLWVLQDYAWKRPTADAVDPIVRQDVRARVWFDDITVMRVPRATLALEPAGVVLLEHETASVRATLRTAAALEMDGRIEVLNSEGMCVVNENHKLRTGGESRIESKLPELPPGVYESRFTLTTNSSVLLQRSLRFAVVRELPKAADAPRGNIGVDLGAWTAVATTNLRALLSSLGAAALRFELSPRTHGVDNLESHDELHSFLREAAADELDATAILISPESTARGEHHATTRSWLQTGTAWRDAVGPLLTRFGGLVAHWQLGREPADASKAEDWDATDVARARREMEYVISISELVVPRDVMDGADSFITAAATKGVDRSPAATPLRVTTSYGVSGKLPTHELPRQLGFIGDIRTQLNESRGEFGECWLTLLSVTSPSSARSAQVDFARRFIFAQAANANHVFLPAPFSYSSASGLPVWEPGELFPVARTLTHFLGGRRAVGAMRLPDDSVGVIFSGKEGGALVVWSRRADAGQSGIDLYLGAAARAFDIWGSPVELKRVTTPGPESGQTGAASTRVHVPLREEPIVIAPIQPALLRFQSTFSLRPTLIQQHGREPRPVVRFANTFDAPMHGQLIVRAPKSWTVEPQTQAFKLPVGETLEQALDIGLPDRQVASAESLRIEIEMTTPIAMTLEFTVPVQVGLQDIGLEAKTNWIGDDLIVEQSLRNQSDTDVSFTGFCQAAGRPRQEREFIAVSTGDVQVRTYRFRNARTLAGGVLHLGVREIGGDRGLEQLVEIPRE